jgi:hypothetical protein
MLTSLLLPTRPAPWPAAILLYLFPLREVDADAHKSHPSTFLFRQRAEEIRSLANFTLGIGVVDGMSQYYISLLLQTLKFLTWSNINNHDFVLISSSLLCEKLERTGLFGLN